ncbi:hypothetical protein PHAVU_007G068300 [Phaseolus vulgaris]|uniref:Uncharacterized protein n=1 Tax=Phaseolus vulgaris TaxID=3885 RepID=V7BFW5_PHAVU|nr:hypothetical protein PHAVU_007G068300g [Phaseolus vulgaris]ESW15381.1 hypothetical protein PHAVU_007G068300g [Phaseolus vulgaris]
MNQNSSLDALANDHQISNPHAGESTSIVDHNPSQCMVKEFEAGEGLGVTESESKFSFLPEEYRHAFEEYCLDQSLEELLSDPCIKFAVETITGVKFKSYYFQMTFQAKHNNIEVEEEGCRKVLSLPENLTIPNECAPTAEIGQTDKGKENSGPSSEIPLDSSCMDPCVEFSQH